MGGFDVEEFDMEQINNIRSIKEKQWKWWVIRISSPMPQIWEIIMNSLTIYALIMNAYLLVFT